MESIGSQLVMFKDVYEETMRVCMKCFSVWVVLADVEKYMASMYTRAIRKSSICCTTCYTELYLFETPISPRFHK